MMDKHLYNRLLDQGLAAQAAGDTARVNQIRQQILAMESGHMPDGDNLAPGLRELAAEQGPIDAALIGAGRTFVELGRGIKELFGGTVERDPTEEAAYAALQQESPWATGIGAGLPYMGPAMLAGGLVGPAAGAARHIAAQGLAAGGTGALQAGTPEERLERGLIDAAMGAGGEGLFRGVQALIPRALPPRLATASQGIEDEARRRSVPFFAADRPEYQTGIAQRLTNAAENTSQFVRARESQRDALAEAAKKLVDETGVTPGDAPGLVQTKANAVLAGRKAEARRLYDRVEALSGDDVVPTPRLIGTLGTIRKELEESLIDDQPLLNVVSRMDERLGAGQEFGRLMTFGDLRTLRSTVGGQVRDTQQGVGQLVGDRATRAWTRIDDALRSDMDAWAQNRPDLYPAWREADKYYRDMVVPFKDQQNRALINMISNETSGDAALDTLLRQTGGATGRLNVLTGMLDNDTSALRSRFVDMAIQKATNAEGTFSPVVFSSQLNRQQGVVEALYGKEALKGLELLMAHLGKGINSAAMNPKTGARNLPLVSAGLGAAGGAALFGGPVGTLGGMVAAPVLGMAAAKLLTTQTGLKMLRGLGRGTGTIEDALAHINTGLAPAAAVGTQRAEYGPGPVNSAIWQAASHAATVNAGHTSRELAALAHKARKNPTNAGRQALSLLRDIRANAAANSQRGVATAVNLHIQRLERLLNDD
jgi:hypothetical protein